MSRALRFACTGCGGCCTGRPNAKEDYYVAVTPAERERIRKYIGVSEGWFRQRYLMRFEDGQYSLRWVGDRCVFLDDAKRCRIYPVRPAQCVTYPFWPDIVESRFGWRVEARRCEGINRGAVVPLTHVRRQLARQRRAVRGSYLPAPRRGRAK